MDLKNVQELQIAFETHLTHEIQEFETTTGAQVTSIEIDRTVLRSDEGYEQSQLERIRFTVNVPRKAILEKQYTHKHTNECFAGGRYATCGKVEFPGDLPRDFKVPE